MTKAFVSGVILSLNNFFGLFNCRVSALERNALISEMLF